MATYAELYDLRTYSPLLNKITVAVAIKSKDVIDNSAVVTQKDWARETLKNPKDVGLSIINQVLVENKNATAAQIESASDAAIQTNVDNAIDDIIADLT